MRRLHRSITVGLALCLVALIGLTSSAGAAREQDLTVGSMAYTAGTSGQDLLQATGMNWVGYHPDTACIGVFTVGSAVGAAPMWTVCGASIKGADNKNPQDWSVEGSIVKLSSGTQWWLRGVLMKNGSAIAQSETHYLITGGASGASLVP